MEVSLRNDPAAFFEEAAGFLEREPFTANVIGVWVSALLAGRAEGSPEDAFVLVREEGEVVGAAMHTPPHLVNLPRLPAGTPAAIARAMATAGRRPPGVGGIVSSTREFAAAWEKETGEASVVTTSMRLYVLGELTRPAGVPGRPRRAGPGDEEVVASFSTAFTEEAQPGRPHDPDHVLRRLAAGDLFLWEDRGEAVSMAGYGRPAAGVARVGPVYTPPGRRGRGYGSAVTAHVSALARTERGAAHVVLYTDLANATSNSIYQAIGYRPDHDAEERTFGRGPSGARGALRSSAPRSARGRPGDPPPPPGPQRGPRSRPRQQGRRPASPSRQPGRGRSRSPC